MLSSNICDFRRPKPQCKSTNLHERERGRCIYIYIYHICSSQSGELQARKVVINSLSRIHDPGSSYHGQRCSGPRLSAPPTGLSGRRRHHPLCFEEPFVVWRKRLQPCPPPTTCSPS